MVGPCQSRGRVSRVGCQSGKAGGVHEVVDDGVFIRGQVNDPKELMKMEKESIQCTCRLGIKEPAYIG